MRTISKVLMVLVCMLLARQASAQVFRFTTVDPAKMPVAEQNKLLVPASQPERFAAGLPVWCVFTIPANDRTMGMFAVGTNYEDATAEDLHVTIVKTLRDYRDPPGPNGEHFNHLSERTDAVAVNGPRTLVFQVMPDAFDHTVTWLDGFLGDLPKFQPKGELCIKIEISGALERYSGTFTYDLTHGLGPWGEWLKANNAVTTQHIAEYAAEKLHPRSQFVKSYRSLRNDPKLTAAARGWWKSHGSSTPIAMKLCSADYILMRSNLGLVTDKQMCVLATFKEGKKCFAMMRRLGYRALGKGVFESELTDASYDTQHLDTTDGEQLYAAKPYEIECSAAN